MQDVNRQLPREERDSTPFPARHSSGVYDTAPEFGAVPSSWIGGLLRGLLTIALVGAVLIGGWAFQRYLIATKPPTPQRASQELPRRVETILAKPADIQPMLELYGQIAAGRSVDLRVLVGGEVKSISPALVEGGSVKPGDVLVKVDPFEFEGALVRARAELAEAEARLVETRAKIVQEQAAAKRAREQMQIAEREVERFSTLRERGATSDATLDAGRTRLSVAQASVESRANQILVLEAQFAREQAGLDRLRWNVRKASRDIENTTLTAPFGGIVSNVAAEAGRLLNVNDRVATLVDLDRFEARFTLSDAQYGRLVEQTGRLEGRAVKVRWKGGSADLTSAGSIDRVSPTVVAGSGGFEVFARLTDQQQPMLFAQAHS